MASLGTEIVLSYDQSGKRLWFVSTTDFTVGDYTAHDQLPINVDDIEAPVMGSNMIKFYMKSGRVLTFPCYAPNDVPVATYGVVTAFGVDITGTTAYERCETVIAQIYNVLNIKIPS